MGFREPTADEAALLRALAARAPNLRLAPGWLNHIRVRSMSDGGMGSLVLLPPGAEADARTMGEVAAELHFEDVDGVPVIASLHTGHRGELFEVDVWKADFSPLIRIPHFE